MATNNANVLADAIVLGAAQVISPMLQFDLEQLNKAKARGDKKAIAEYQKLVDQDYEFLHSQIDFATKPAKKI